VAELPTKEKFMTVQFQEIHRARVYDLKLLLQAVIDDRAFPSWVQVNQLALDRFADMTKGRIQVPGVEWYTEKRVRIE
jgi:hypothetical protein